MKSAAIAETEEAHSAAAQASNGVGEDCVLREGNLQCPDPPFHASSWMIAGDELLCYLGWISDDLEWGFDKDTVAALYAKAMPLQHAQQIVFDCQAQYAGNSVLLRLGIRRAGSSFEVSICTMPDLSNIVDWSMERYYDEAVEASQCYRDDEFAH